MKDDILVLFGGTGQQFGVAVADLASQGLLDRPRRIYVVDQDMESYARDLDKAFDPPNTVDVTAPGAWTPRNFTHYRPLTQAAMGTVEAFLAANQPNTPTPLWQAAVPPNARTLALQTGFFARAQLATIVCSIQGEDGGAFPSTLVTEVIAHLEPKTRIIVAGSIAGGTGAGLMLPFVRRLRQEAGGHNVPIIMIAVLPWLRITPNPNNPQTPTDEQTRMNAALGLEAIREAAREWHDGDNNVGTTYAVVAGRMPDETSPESGTKQVVRRDWLLYHTATILRSSLWDFTHGRFSDPTAGQLDNGTYAYSGPSANGKGEAAKAAMLDGAAMGLESSDDVPLSHFRWANYYVRERLAWVAGRNLEACFGILDNPGFSGQQLYDALRRFAGVVYGPANKKLEGNAARKYVAAAVRREAAQTADALHKLDDRLREHYGAADLGPVPTPSPRGWQNMNSLEQLNYINELLSKADDALRGKISEQATHGAADEFAKTFVECVRRDVLSAYRELPKANRVIQAGETPSRACLPVIVPAAVPAAVVRLPNSDLEALIVKLEDNVDLPVTTSAPNHLGPAIVTKRALLAFSSARLAHNKLAKQSIALWNRALLGEIRRDSTLLLPPAVGVPHSHFEKTVGSQNPSLKHVGLYADGHGVTAISDPRCGLWRSCNDRSAPAPAYDPATAQALKALTTAFVNRVHCEYGQKAATNEPWWAALAKEVGWGARDNQAGDGALDAALGGASAELFVECGLRGGYVLVPQRTVPGYRETLLKPIAAILASTVGPVQNRLKLTLGAGAAGHSPILVVNVSWMFGPNDVKPLGVLRWPVGQITDHNWVDFIRDGAWSWVPDSECAPTLARLGPPPLVVTTVPELHAAIAAKLQRQTALNTPDCSGSLPAQFPNTGLLAVPPILSAAL